MSAIIDIKLGVFDDEVRALDSARKSMNESQEEIIKALDDLASAWTGAGGAAYAQAANCVKAGIIEYSRGLGQMIDNLLKAREAVVCADEAGAQQ